MSKPCATAVTPIIWWCSIPPVSGHSFAGPGLRCALIVCGLKIVLAVDEGLVDAEVDHLGDCPAEKHRQPDCQLGALHSGLPWDHAPNGVKP
jgi:hypothetical protein